MPTYSLFPHQRKPSSSDDHDSSYRNSSSSSVFTSPTSSITSESYDFLPPIRSPSPLPVPRAQPTTFDNTNGYSRPSPSERKPPIYRMSLQKALPDPPTTIFDRLEVPLSFHPTRRAPLPPFQQSWIDLNDDDDDDDTNFGVPRVAPQAPAQSKIEKEIMRMLQFNEEKEVEKRIAEKKGRNRKSTLNFGGFNFMSKLKRSMSVGTNVRLA
jgi:hypothetical protein